MGPEAHPAQWPCSCLNICFWSLLDYIRIEGTGMMFHFPHILPQHLTPLSSRVSLDFCPMCHPPAVNFQDPVTGVTQLNQQHLKNSAQPGSNMSQGACRWLFWLWCSQYCGCLVCGSLKMEQGVPWTLCQPILTIVSFPRRLFTGKQVGEVA